MVLLREKGERGLFSLRGDGVQLLSRLRLRETVEARKGVWKAEKGSVKEDLQASLQKKTKVSKRERGKSFGR